MANTIDWGKATQNNTNGFGKYQNTINAGDIYAESWAGETAIVGTSAAFSYSKSSYHQGEADPTPTITGTTGGMILVTDETGGAIPAFYDGTNWRRVTDRAIVS